MPTVPPSPIRLGCVSFLNARPLIEGLDGRDDLIVRYDVPSRLLEDLESGDVDMALCPVIDFQYAHQPLEIVPVGGIGCNGPTPTVRLFSRVPIEQVTSVAVDTDSHTSIMLMKVILHDAYGIRPVVTQLSADRASLRLGEHRPTTVLLIGDKVVLDCPTVDDYPHQLDLGVAWKQLTGLPFVFAVWMCRRGAKLGHVPALLQQQRVINSAPDRVAQIVRDRALPLGWPADLARRYMTELLQYAVGPAELEAMQLFWRRAHDLGYIERHRGLELYGNAPSPAV
jgi:chorismate dehydratase